MIEYISTLSLTFWVSLAVSLITALYFIVKQSGFYGITKKNLSLYQNFFNKEGEYDIFDSDGKGNNNSARIKNVASEKAALHSLIEDINEYLGSCKGTATFEIIQNKTERRITKMYDNTVSKSSFPTHYGLMGTFVGVFIGLLMFLVGSMLQGGITDDSIHSLILGVLVSMSTSFIGLKMSTKANDMISNAKTKIDEDKNEFYEFVQNKLMTSVNVSLTEALGSLHETVTAFEPSFTKVIDGFKQTFQECTRAFDDNFRMSVHEMVGAVTTMSTNINQITDNVSLLENLLNRLSGSEWTSYMREFAEANEHFKSLTHSLNDFERARRMMLAAAQETINLQKSYNDSLQLPRQVAENINGILQRVVTFEKSINDLGVTIAQTQMIGNVEIEEIKQQISAIKAKHRVAEQYIDTANNKLEMFFDSQLIELKRLESKYLEALEELFSAYEKITDDHKDEINQRHEIFKNAIEDKFDMAGVRSELANLKKIPDVEKKVDDVKKGQEQLQNTNEDIKKKINTFSIVRVNNDKGVTDGSSGSGAGTSKDNGNNTQKQKPDITEQIIKDAQREKENLEKIQKSLEDNQHGASTNTSSGGKSEPVVSDSSAVVGNQDAEIESEPKKKGLFSRFFRRE